MPNRKREAQRPAGWEKGNLKLGELPQGTVSGVKAGSNTNMRKQTRNQNARLYTDTYLRA